MTQVKGPVPSSRAPLGTGPIFAAVEGRPQTGPRWLQDVRDKAAARFAALGFPTVRDEDWRFTNVSPIAATDFRPPSTVAVAPSEVDALPYGHLPFRITVLNGSCRA
jgi:Fe-S cluster assembly protein SufD